MDEQQTLPEPTRLPHVDAAARRMLRATGEDLDAALRVMDVIAENPLPWLATLETSDPAYRAVRAEDLRRWREETTQATIDLAIRLVESGALAAARAALTQGDGVQRIAIVSLPPLAAEVLRDSKGRVVGVVDG